MKIDLTKLRCFWWEDEQGNVLEDSPNAVPNEKQKEKYKEKFYDVINEDISILGDINGI